VSGDSGARFGGEPALAAGLIQSRHDVEVRTPAGHQAIFIARTGNSGGEFYEGPAGSSASIDVVPDYRDSWGVPRRLPCERNAVRSFVTARKPKAKQGTCSRQDSD
jgi:hypothetical protein